MAGKRCHSSFFRLFIESILIMIFVLQFALIIPLVSNFICDRLRALSFTGNSMVYASDYDILGYTIDDYLNYYLDSLESETTKYLNIYNFETYTKSVDEKFFRIQAQWERRLDVLGKALTEKTGKINFSNDCNKSNFSSIEKSSDEVSDNGSPGKNPTVFDNKDYFEEKSLEFIKRSNEIIERGKALYLALHVAESLPSAGDSFDPPINSEKIVEIKKKYRALLMELLEEEYNNFLTALGDYSSNSKSPDNSNLNNLNYEKSSNNDSKQYSSVQFWENYRDGFLKNYKHRSSDVYVRVVEGLFSDLGVLYEDIEDDYLRRFYSIANENGGDNRNVGTSYFEEALLRERKKTFYEQKLFLSKILNNRFLKINRLIYEDSDSLRREVEKTHAEIVAKKITEEVENELDRIVTESMDSLLNQQDFTEGEIATLNELIGDNYQQGLEIWASAAVRLLQKQNEWFRNYEKVYKDGTGIWHESFLSLDKRKNEWIEGFKNQVKEGISRWDKIFNENDQAQKDLADSLLDFMVQKEKAFNCYLRELEQYNASGFQSIAEIDSYNQELKYMLRNLLSPFTNEELTEDQISGLLNLFNEFRGDSRAFWYQDKSFKDLFDFKTTEIKISNTSKTDKIMEGPYYYFLDSIEIDSGFKLLVELDAVVRRYDKGFEGLDGICFNHEDYNESAFYYIVCRFDQYSGKWIRSIQHTGWPHRKREKKTIDNFNVVEISSIAGRYLNEIQKINKAKSEIFNSISDIQASVIESIERNTIDFNNFGELTIENFEDYYFGPGVLDQNSFLCHPIDLEIYRNYYEREFWENQADIIGETLKYILERPEREESTKTLERYALSKDTYQEALDIYQRLIDRDLDSANLNVGEATEVLNEKKEELLSKQRELQEVTAELSSLKLANLNQKLFYDSLWDDLNNLLSGKKEYLSKVFEFEEDNLNDAVDVAIKNGIESQKKLYEYIYRSFLDSDDYRSIEKVSLIGDLFSEKFLEIQDAISENNLDLLPDIFNSIDILSQKLPDISAYRDIKLYISNLNPVVDLYISTQGDVSQKLFLEFVSLYEEIVKCLFTVSVDERIKTFTAVMEGADNYRETENILESFSEKEFFNSVVAYLENIISEFEGGSKGDGSGDTAGVSGDSATIDYDIDYDRDVLEFLLEELKSENFRNYSIHEYLSLLKSKNEQGFLIIDGLYSRAVDSGNNFSTLLDEVNQAAPENDFLNILNIMRDEARRLAHFQSFASSEKALDGYVNFIREVVTPGSGLQYDLVSKIRNELEEAINISRKVGMLPVIRQLRSMIYQVDCENDDESANDLNNSLYFDDELSYPSDVFSGNTVSPTEGNLNEAVYSLLKIMNNFDNNEFLKSYIPVLEKTLTDYVAASIFLLNERGFERIQDKNQQKIDDFIALKIDEYLSDLFSGFNVNSGIKCPEENSVNISNGNTEGSLEEYLEENLKEESDETSSEQVTSEEEFGEFLGYFNEGNMRKYVEQKLTSLLDGEKDIRTVLFQNLDEITQVHGILSENEENSNPEVMPYGSSVVFVPLSDYKTISDISGLNKIFLEVSPGFSEWPSISVETSGQESSSNSTQTDLSIDSDENPIPLFLSDSYALNRFVEYQNRFIQGLLTLTNIGALGDDTIWEILALRMGKKINYFDLVTGKEHSIDLFLGSDLPLVGFNEETFGSRDNYLRVFFENNYELLNDNFKSTIDEFEYTSGLINPDSNGFTKQHMLQNYNFDMLASSLYRILPELSSILKKSSELERKIDFLFSKNVKIEKSIDFLEAQVKEAENELDNAIGEYNSIVSSIAAHKETVDKLYNEYLKSKEIYFYANNIYFGDNVDFGFETYRDEFLKYSKNSAYSGSIYEVLKDIKVLSAQGENGHDSSSVESGEDPFFDRELDKIKTQLLNKENALNQAEEALYLIRIFKFELTKRIDNLESAVYSLNERLSSDTIDDDERISLEEKLRDISNDLEQLKKLSQNWLNLDFRYIPRKWWRWRYKKARDPGKRNTPHAILLEALDRSNPGEMGDYQNGAYITVLDKFLAEVRNFSLEGALISGSSVFDGLFNGEDADLDDLIETIEKYVLRSRLDLKNYREEALECYTKKLDDFFEGLREYAEWTSLKINLDNEKLLNEKAGGLISLLENKPVINKPVEDKSFGDKPLRNNPWGGNSSISTGDPAGIFPDLKSMRENLVREGAILLRYDLSDPGLLKREMKRKKDLFYRLNPIGLYSTVMNNTGESFYYELLSILLYARQKVDADRLSIKRQRFSLQLNTLSEERLRFEDKLSLGLVKGIDEWNARLRGLQGDYRKWVSDMKKRLADSKLMWHEKEIYYVSEREAWLEKVKNNSSSSLSDLREAVEEFSDENGLELDDLAEGAGRSSFIKGDISIPGWVNNYEVLANRTFSPLKKIIFKNNATEVALKKLEDSILAFDNERDSLEAEKLYFQLIRNRDAILSNIESVDIANEKMIEEYLSGYGYVKKGSGYEKRVFVDYSLLGGKKYETARIGFFSPFRVNQNEFRLPEISRVKNLSDVSEQRVFIFEEMKKLEDTRDKILGNRAMAGEIYIKHVGRIPIGDEIQKYVEERQESERGIIGNVVSKLRKAAGNLIEKMGSLFGMKRSSDDDYEEFQSLLIASIKGNQNRELETGSSMLEFNYYQVKEQIANEKKDSGFINAPLFPGGPSLKSIGSVALAVVTAGSSAVVQATAQLGLSIVSTLVTHAEGKIGDEEAVLDILKDSATSFLTGGLSKTGGFLQGLGDKLYSKIDSLSSSFGSVMASASIEAGIFFGNQIISTGIESIEMENGNLVYDAYGFGTGIGTSLFASLGRFSGVTAGGLYDVSRGATWVDNDFQYNLLSDTARGIYLEDYYNNQMKLASELLSSVTEQGINNLTGIQNGIDLNILDTGDFGLKNSVGLLKVTLGLDGISGLELSTSGTNICLSSIRQMKAGFERYSLYSERFLEGDIDAKKLYLAGNMLRYGFSSGEAPFVGSKVDAGPFGSNFNADGMSATLISLLENGDTSDFDYSSSGLGKIGACINGMVNQNKILSDNQPSLKNGVLLWDINIAGNYTAFQGYGMLNRYKYYLENSRQSAAELFSTVELAELNAVENPTAIDKALDFSDLMVSNRISALGFSLNIWDKLKNRFGLSNPGLDAYSRIFNDDSRAFNDFVVLQSNYMDDVNTGVLISELQNSPFEEVVGIGSIYEGVLGSDGYEFVVELIDRGIMEQGYGGIKREIGLGKRIHRGTYGDVSATEVVKVDDGVEGEDYYGYFFVGAMDDMNEQLDSINGVLLQRYFSADGFIEKKLESGAEYFDINARKLNPEVVLDAGFNKLIEGIKNPVMINRWIYARVYEGLRGNNAWAKIFRKDTYFEKPSGKYVIFSVRGGTPLCNYLVENTFIITGVDVKGKLPYKGKFIAYSGLYENNGMVANELYNYVGKNDNFVPVGNIIGDIINDESLGVNEKDELINLILESYIDKGMIVFDVWYNPYGKGHTYIRDKESTRWDVNITKVIDGEVKFENIPMYLYWLDSGIKYSNYIEESINYGSFDFREQWIIDINNKEYNSEFGVYEYKTYVSKYSSILTMDLEKIFEYGFLQ